MPPHVIKQLMHAFETLLTTHPFDLPRARYLGSRWSEEPDSAILEDTALHQKLCSLTCADSECEAKSLIHDILGVAEKERLNGAR